MAYNPEGKSGKGDTIGGYLENWSLTDNQIIGEVYFDQHYDITNGLTHKFTITAVNRDGVFRSRNGQCYQLGNPNSDYPNMSLDYLLAKYPTF